MKKYTVLALISSATLFTAVNAERSLTNKTEEAVKLLKVIEMQKNPTNLQMQFYQEAITLEPGQTVALSDTRNYFYRAKERLPRSGTWVHEADPSLFGQFVGNTGEYPLSSSWMRIIHYSLVRDIALKIVEDQ